MKLLIYSLLIFFISACGKISAPSIITPDYSQRVSEGGYGDAPLTYTNILKKYLINKLPNHQETKIEFVNEPQKLSIDHLGDNYSGYRVCLSINEKQDGYYRGWRNHFFMINNDQVTLHLFDSGLLTIPFEYCITRDESKTMLVKNIPDSIENENNTLEEIENAKSIENMDSDKPSLAYIDPKEMPVKIKDKYILCMIDNEEITFVFNESNKTFYQFEFDTEKSFEPIFTEILIAAKRQDTVIDINRVSGFIEITTEKSKKSGKCDILNKTKF